MSNPQLKLETIYRQEADNPIIKISEMVRKGKYPYIQFSKSIKKLDKRDEILQMNY